MHQGKSICGDIARRQLSASQEESPHQKPHRNRPAASSRASSLRTTRKQISVALLNSFQEMMHAKELCVQKITKHEALLRANQPSSIYNRKCLLRRAATDQESPLFSLQRICRSATLAGLRMKFAEGESRWLHRELTPARHTLISRLLEGKVPNELLKARDAMTKLPRLEVFQQSYQGPRLQSPGPVPIGGSQGHMP
ncbi:uncharacterized protein LOC116458836 isoform X2 [Hylobates moloch]|uniref:uncharacterized protein LOC116458836 isoform X2 n=1 Tax=Hylobates moloch TaxID=81572 RepID=UPI00267457A7|nr:uncharacterized protein LOC116458836 isoform X2 [Hylobates moloch]